MFVNISNNVDFRMFINKQTMSNKLRNPFRFDANLFIFAIISINDNQK